MLLVPGGFEASLRGLGEALLLPRHVGLPGDKRPDIRDAERAPVIVYGDAREAEIVYIGVLGLPVAAAQLSADARGGALIAPPVAELGLRLLDFLLGGLQRVVALKALLDEGGEERIMPHGPEPCELPAIRRSARGRAFERLRQHSLRVCRRGGNLAACEHDGRKDCGSFPNMFF